MPLYEYQCKECEERFETLVSFSRSNDPIECPHCGSEKTDKLLSTFSASVSSGKSSLPCGADSACSASGGT